MDLSHKFPLALISKFLDFGFWIHISFFRGKEKNEGRNKKEKNIPKKKGGEKNHVFCF